MGICIDNCGDTDLIANPQTTCAADLRRVTPSRLFFFLCSTTLPDPVSNAAMLALFNSGEIVASMPLANIEFGDVTYEEVVVDGCNPVRRIPVSREMTFEDRYGIADTASPSTGTFLDYDFWQDKLNKNLRLNVMVAYCNGDVRIARKEGTDELLTASLTVTVNYQTPQTQGNGSTEFKAGSAIFNGDPLDLRNKPEFNYIDAGIVL